MKAMMQLVGLMSGTSLDGLDVAVCDFAEDENAFGSTRYEVVLYGNRVHCGVRMARTLPYSEEWRSRLMGLMSTSAFDYALADVQLAQYWGEGVCQLLSEQHIRPDYVASHGHTVFHRPDLGLTTQIGNADVLAAVLGCPVVYGFRTLDVALGGQGAPLVPIGDRLLFAEYDGCLNLGGIANISFEEASSGRRVAFDICPCNMAMNELAAHVGRAYDAGGALAQQGAVSEPLLRQLNELPFYDEQPPKSLGREWYERAFQPVVTGGALLTVDALATVVEHVAIQVGKVVGRAGLRSLLVTGGGAHNAFLVSRLQQHCPRCQVVVPSPVVVDYKEAIIFALLAFLRISGRRNVLSSVTGARADSCSGSITGRLPV